MNIGEHIRSLKKHQVLPLYELVKEKKVSRTIFCNYKRNFNKKSIEVALKLAKIFNISIDSPVAEGKFPSFDKNLLKRVVDIEKLDENTKKPILFH